MSTQTVTRKRKSADGTTATAKKIKVTQSADKPAPLKSALKKPLVEKAEESVQPPTETRTSKKTTKKKSTNEEAVAVVENTTLDDTEVGGTELTPDQTATLLAGFSSSEDEADSEDEAGIAVSSLPKAPTAGAIQRRIKQAISEQDDPETIPGVIYIGRIPHGFFEPQMKAYFSQFGEIQNLRLARNKKTGRSQHHAFVEFASAAVADIVAKTMDRYLLFGHILQVRRVPREQVKEGMFKGSKRRKKPAPRNRLEGRKLKQGATREEWEKRIEQENKRRIEKAEKLRETGYEFEMPLVKSVSEVPVRSKTVETDAEVGGAAFLENGEVEIVQTTQTVPGEGMVTETTVAKKRPASGKMQTKKVVKKLKA